MPRGQLRMYVSAASGAGTTYAMLDEGIRRQRRGANVAVGWVDPHGRPATAALLAELLGERQAPVELDTAALLEQRPDVALVDELAAHGERHARRWDDVDELLDAGIDVITTLTVQQIESLADQVATILGSTPTLTVPDAFLGRVDQIELIDITPEAIRRRIAHGNVFDPDEDPAHADLFNSDAFTRLRVLLLSWLVQRLTNTPADPGHEQLDARTHPLRADAPSWAPSRRRQWMSLVGGAVTLTLLTIVLVGTRGDLEVSTALSLYLLAVVGISAVGGWLPGLAAAVAAPVVANWFLIEPYHTLRINQAENVLELAVFVAVAVIVSVFVSVSARRAAHAEAATLAAIAAEADALARGDELRTAILRAVSHDLRSPLASIKASVSSLRQPDVEWPRDLRDEFLSSVEEETDRLTTIVSNLLDMSRLEAGVLTPVLRPVALEEVVPSAIHSLGARAEAVELALPDDTPEVVADPALLERVLANLVGNACEFSPGRVRVSAHAQPTTVQVYITDHGPGIHPRERHVVLQPFHRLSDRGTNSGVGLGLAIADGLTTAMGGTLDLRDTPGGGLTAVVILPRQPVVRP